jgi:hypothetical protein
MVIEDMYEQNGIGWKDEYRRRIARLDDALADLGDETVIEDIPAVDWSMSAQSINAVLHALWDHVQLGPDMLPVRDGFAWRRPEYRDAR